jgi:hypothetical protein
MDLASPYLQFDPTTYELEPSVQQLLDFRLDILDETSHAALQGGLWWLYPLGRSFSSRLIGLRLCPGVPLAVSPVVIADGAEAVTLCSRPASLVPTLFFHLLMTGDSGWGEAAALSDADWQPVVALHRTLGGTDDLQRVRTLVADRDLARALAVGAGDYPRWVRAIAETRSRLDGAPHSAAYWRYAAEVAIAKSAAALPPEAGCWNSALAALVFWASSHDRAEARRHLEREAAWRLTHLPPALDTSRDGTGPLTEASSRHSTELGVAAAKVVVKSADPAWVGDPLLPAISALANTPSYDGAQHAAAAAALERAGHHAAAFTALTAAAYWSFHATGAAKAETLDDAIRVTGQTGSPDVTAALVQLRDARAALAAEAGD